MTTSKATMKRKIAAAIKTTIAGYLDEDPSLSAADRKKVGRLVADIKVETNKEAKRALRAKLNRIAPQTKAGRRMMRLQQVEQAITAALLDLGLRVEWKPTKRSGNAPAPRHVGRKKVLEVIRSGHQTRSAMVKATAMSMVSVRRHVSELLASGVIVAVNAGAVHDRTWRTRQPHPLYIKKPRCGGLGEWGWAMPQVVIQ